MKNVKCASQFEFADHLISQSPVVQHNFRNTVHVTLYINFFVQNGRINSSTPTATNKDLIQNNSLTLNINICSFLLVCFSI